MGGQPEWEHRNQGFLEYSAQQTLSNNWELCSSLWSKNIMISDWIWEIQCFRDNHVYIPVYIYIYRFDLSMTQRVAISDISFVRRQIKWSSAWKIVGAHFDPCLGDIPFKNIWTHLYKKNKGFPSAIFWLPEGKSSQKVRLKSHMLSL